MMFTQISERNYGHQKCLESLQIFSGQSVRVSTNIIYISNEKVNINENCPWCHNGKETDMHVPFQCDFTGTTCHMADI